MSTHQRVTPTEQVENVAPVAPAVYVDSHPGAALEPAPGTNPMLAGLGPGAWADRAHRLDVTVDGDPKIQPLRRAPGFSLHPRDPNPIGMPVVGLDGVEAGVVREAWVDISELALRYLEVEVHSNGRRVLLPVPFSKIDTRRGLIRVKSIASHHFADVPGTQHPDYVSLLEEDKISAYYGAGYLYASPDRMGPVL
jgi:photosynthetic reaction center H subunit